MFTFSHRSRSKIGCDRSRLRLRHHFLDKFVDPNRVLLGMPFIGGVRPEFTAMNLSTAVTGEQIRADTDAQLAYMSERNWRFRPPPATVAAKQRFFAREANVSDQ